LQILQNGRMGTDVARILEAIGPRLRALRTGRGQTLSDLAEHTGIPVSTLSRLETGRRQPTLDLLLPLAEAHRISLDRLIAAPETGDPRLHLAPQRHAAGGLVVPLTRYPGRVQVFKHVIGPREPRLVSHEGRAWIYVLAGTLRLLLGEDELHLAPGETAEFDAMTPHWFGPSDDTPVEVLHLFGPRGDTAVPRVVRGPAAGGGAADPGADGRAPAPAAGPHAPTAGGPLAPEGTPTLRRLREDDAPAVLAAFAAREDMARQGEVRTADEARRYVGRLLAPDSPHEAWALAVDDALVGLVAVTVDEENRSGWFWYWTAGPARGRGWTGRAAATLADWALGARGLERLELGHRVNNPASGAVAARAGFVTEGVERGKFLVAGERIDVITYGRLRTDPAPDTEPLPMADAPR
jgi:RimJ/RimL family protein N-acetyltransferase/transcriptional regulator with XRE-family HTH domain